MPPIPRSMPSRPEFHSGEATAGRGAVAIFAAAAIWLAMGFTDGPVYLVMARLRVDGHLLFIMPIVLLYFGSKFLSEKLHVSTAALMRQAGIALLFLAGGIVQTAVLGSYRTRGLVQLYTMVATMVFFRDIFSENSEILEGEFRQSITTVHYIICAYCILSWITLNLFHIGIDFDFGRASGFASSSLVGFKRVSGFQREPAWAGLALSVSFLSTYLLNHHRRGLTFALYAAALAASGSATGAMFAFVFGAYVVFRQRGLGLGAKAFVMLAPLLAGGILFQERIARILAGSDPSAMMRVRSFDVGWRVIQSTFPVGTGQGNFRNAARYGSVWSNYIDLSRTSFYKTDIFWMNIVAELGLMGILVLAIFVWVYASSRRAPIAILAVFFLLAAGTLIMPFLFALSALSGLTAAARRAERLSFSPETSRPNAGVPPHLPALG